MAVFVSSNCLTKGVRETVSALINEGINNVELGPSQEYDEEIEEFLTSIKNARFIVHNYFPAPQHPFILNLASSNNSIRERSIAQAKKSIELCHLLGSELFSVHAGFVTDPDFGTNHFNFSSLSGDADYETAFNNFVASIKELLDMAVPLGIKVAVENNVCPQGMRGHLLLSEAPEFERLLTEVPSPNLGITLDLGHLNVSAKSLNFDKNEFIRRIRGKVFAVHIHDNDATVDSHELLKEDSWILRVLAHENFDEQIPIVLEAHHLTLNQIPSQLDLIRERIPMR